MLPSCFVVICAPKKGGIEEEGGIKKSSMAAMLFNGLDYRIGNWECLFLDHLQGFFGIGSEQIIQDQIMQLQSSSAWVQI